MHLKGLEGVLIALIVGVGMFEVVVLVAEGEGHLGGGGHLRGGGVALKKLMLGKEESVLTEELSL